VFYIGRYNKRAPRLPDFLPWAALVAPGVILQTPGAFQTTLAFRGPDLSTSLPHELDSAVARLNNTFTRLGSGWALFVEAQRYRTTHYATADWPNAAACLVDVERRYAFSQGSHAESDHFLTLCYLPPRDAVNKLAGAFFTAPVGSVGDSTHFRRELAYFTRTVAELTDILRGVFPSCFPLNDDDTLSYLHSTISTNRHSVRTPKVPFYLNTLLPDQAFHAGDVPMLGDHFVATTTITGFPSETTAGILDELNTLPIPYRWTSRFIFLGHDEAKAELESYRKRWFGKRKGLLALVTEQMTKQEAPLVDNAAADKAADADAALRELGEGLVSYGFLTTSITVLDKDRAALRRNLLEIKKIVQAAGFVCRDETFNATDAWLGTLPGHCWANVRRPLVSSLNLAHLMPLSAIWSGEPESAHLKEVTGVGTPHLQCSTEASTPFRLSLDVANVGHTLIVGPTGAGKSTLLALFNLQWLKYPRARVRILDKACSARAATLAMGGTVYEPGTSSFAFQPLARVHEPQEYAWALQWLLDVLALQNVRCTPDQKLEVAQALTLTAASPPKQRTLSTLQLFLASPELRAAIGPYVCGGQFGRVFDADSEPGAAGIATWEMYETGPLMALGRDGCAPGITYLLHRIERDFDGSPTLLCADEFARLLGHPVFEPFIETALREFRKKNVYLIAASQGVGDAAASRIAEIIHSQTANKIYLADPSATDPDIAEGYRRQGLSAAEISRVAAGQKRVDYYIRSEKGRRSFRLDLGPVALAFAGTSSADDQKFLDTLSEHDPAEAAERILRYRGVDWAADYLAAARLNPRVSYSSAGSF